MDAQTVQHSEEKYQELLHGLAHTLEGQLVTDICVHPVL
jgi:hypothetical protein